MPGIGRSSRTRDECARLRLIQYVDDRMSFPEDLCILVFGHTRPLHLSDVLSSLEKQGAISCVDVWLDGHQSIRDIQYRLQLVNEVVRGFDVRQVVAHNGMLGFRKLMLHALDHASRNYRYVIVLEDDCFPVRDAIEVFLEELRAIENNENIFSVYGHHFLVPGEGETFGRFQGWGWATTSEKLQQHVSDLIYLYSLRESEYLEFVSQALSPEIIQRLDLTPERQPTDVIRHFFAWDETLALLTALAGQVHKKTFKRVIYNFGACEDSSRFDNVEDFLRPPFNMVSHESVWDYY